MMTKDWKDRIVTLVIQFDVRDIKDNEIRSKTFYLLVEEAEAWFRQQLNKPKPEDLRIQADDTDGENNYNIDFP